MHALVGLLLSINQHTVFKVPSFTHCKYMIVSKKFEKMGHVTPTTPISWYFLIPSLTLDIVLLCTQLDNYSFSHSRYTIGAPNIFNGSRDLIITLLGVVCHPCARTCYDKPVHQIVILYLQSLRKCASKDLSLCLNKTESVGLRKD